MSETSSSPSRKKKLLIAGGSAVAILALTGGTIVGVNISNAKTDDLCAAALSAAKTASTDSENSQDAAAKVRSEAEDTEGYTSSEERSAFVKDVEVSSNNLKQIKLPEDCTSQDEAEELQTGSKNIISKASELNSATEKLSTNVSVFKAETKRLAAEKAAREAAEEAEAAKIAEEARASVKEEEAAVEVVPQPVEDYRLNAPQGPGHTAYVPPSATYAPAPVPVPAPAPVPVPAPVTNSDGGGWTPPPPGSGPGGGCTQIADYVMCAGD